MTTEPLSVSPEWSALHLRVACSETLNDEDRAAYEAVLKRLDEEEHALLSAGAATTTRKIRQELAALGAECARLTREHAAREAQITALEARLDERSRRAHPREGT